MSITGPDKKRRLLPRWQSSGNAIDAGEMSSPKYSVTSIKEDEHFEARKIEWEETHSADVAAELIASAIVLDRAPEVEAAAKVLASASGAATEILREMAEQVLKISNTESKKIAVSPPSYSGIESLYTVVSRLRHYVSKYPRDSYAWIDLGRAYAILGKRKKTERSLSIARVISPNDRFVLRSTARYYVHIDETERALQLLQRSVATKLDPWLMSAEIAVSQIAGRKSRFAAQAIKSLENPSWTPLSQSEVAGSAATFLLEDGARRQAKKLFQQSLKEPTENAIAQAEWASEKDGQVIVPAHLLDAPDTYEANALRNFSIGNWKSTIEQARLWGDYEPTSSRPMMLGAYVASVAFEDGSTIIDLSDRALRLDGKNTSLLNNKIVGLAYLGRLAEAASLIKEVAVDKASLSSQPALYATTGLVLFRSGDSESGRAFYERAIQHPFARQNKRTKALAAWHLAIEEARIGSPIAEGALRRAGELAKDIQAPEFDQLKRRAQLYMAANNLKK